MDKYTVEIDGENVGTMNVKTFHDAAMAMMWSYGGQCKTLVVYPSDKPEQSCLYVDVEMTSPLNIHSREFTTFQRRADLDAYLQVLAK